MDLQLASFGDLDQISMIEKETNKYPWTPINFKSSLDAGNSSIVLRDNKKILGYAFFSVIGTDSHLLNITVSKNYQGRGYGKKILKQVLLQSKVLGASIVFLEVRVSNDKAIDFYEKFDRLKYALRVLPAETRLTVYRRFEMTRRALSCGLYRAIRRPCAASFVFPATRTFRWSDLSFFEI